jgi:hypothetical protein
MLKNLSKKDKAELYIVRIGDITEYICVGDIYFPSKTFIDQVEAMAFMWTNCQVPMKQFNIAITQLKKHRHTHAHFSSNGKLFLYTDNERIDE